MTKVSQQTSQNTVTLNCNSVRHCGVSSKQFILLQKDNVMHDPVGETQCAH